MMGALKSKGFGRCELEKIGLVDTHEVPLNERGKPKVKPLNTRIPVVAENGGEFKALTNNGKPTKFLSEIFGIKKIIKPRYGYLFKPDKYRRSGVYVLSLFEGADIIGPRFLLKNIGDENGD